MVGKERMKCSGKIVLLSIVLNQLNHKAIKRFEADTENMIIK